LHRLAATITGQWAGAWHWWRHCLVNWPRSVIGWPSTTTRPRPAVIGWTGRCTWPETGTDDVVNGDASLLHQCRRSTGLLQCDQL